MDLLCMTTFTFEIEPNKWNDGKIVSLKVGKDYWIDEDYYEFFTVDSRIENVMTGMLSGELETYDSISSKIEKIKDSVKEHVKNGDTEFTLTL